MANATTRPLGQRLILPALILAAVVGLLWLIVAATQANLERLGVDPGIDFLFRRAGFEIGQKLIPYSANSTVLAAFAVALVNTMVLGFAAIAGASLIGVLIGAARLSRNWLLARLGAVYVETFRNVPALLQVFFWYYVVLSSLPLARDSYQWFGLAYLNNRGLFVPAPEGAVSGLLLALLAGFIGAFALGRALKHRREATGRGWPAWPFVLAVGIGVPALVAWMLGDALRWEVPRLGRFGYHGGFVLMPEFLALAVGLSAYHAAYVAEIVRSGFNAVDRGQREAAQALGLSGAATFRLVLLPQAMRAIVPPLTTVYLNLFKGTSLAAAIAYPEVVSVMVGTVNNLVGQPVVIMGLTLLVYVTFSLAIAAGMNWYNRRLAVRGS